MQVESEPEIEDGFDEAVEAALVLEEDVETTLVSRL